MEINIGLTELIIGFIGIILAYFGVGKIKKDSDNKKVENAHEKVGESKANDEDRNEIIEKANSVIAKNLEAIKNAKDILNNSDSDK